MIGKCWFERFIQGYTTGKDIIQEAIYPDMDYGLYMVEYDAPPPQPRIYRATIEGRDGSLDLSEWEGRQQVRFDDRTITIKFRDMHGQESANAFIRKMLGNKFYIHFEDDIEYYFRGRCEEAETETRKHVTDVELTFTCYPFRYSVARVTREYTVPARGFINDKIIISGHNVIPTVTASGVESGLSVYSSFNILRSSVEVYPITVDGEVSTSGAIFMTGDNNISINNANTTNDLKITVAWRTEVV